MHIEIHDHHATRPSAVPLTDGGAELTLKKGMREDLKDGDGDGGGSKRNA